MTGRIATAVVVVLVVGALFAAGFVGLRSNGSSAVPPELVDSSRGEVRTLLPSPAPALTLPPEPKSSPTEEPITKEASVPAAPLENQLANPEPASAPADSASQEQTAGSPPEFSSQDLPLQSTKAVEVDINRFRQLLPKDAIAPIYNPRFVQAMHSDLDPRDLVMGVQINGESKAYPIGPLIRREMVNDVVGGIPILITW